MHGEITGLTPEKETRRIFFRDPKSLISKTDESKSPHTSTKYESKDSDMVESSTETGTGNASFVKKKLKTSTPFSGKREDLQKILQEVKIYLLANSGIYTSDLDKFLFVLSFITKGDANSWKEEFYDTAEQKAAQDGSSISLGTYKDLMDLIIKNFSPCRECQGFCLKKWLCIAFQFC